MSDFSSCLFTGKVVHHRYHPARHRFAYRVFSICIDLDELPWLQKLKLFSINRFNLFSFMERDHGSGEGHLAGEIRRLLIRHGYPQATHRIRLLCYPRILGYTFNPLSVYYCYDANEELAVVLYEVSNTFGSRHTYILPAEAQARPLQHSCDKAMYVSPFMPMQTRYGFRILPPQQQVSVLIRQTDSRSGDPLLNASFTGKRTALGDRQLARLFFTYPLMTLKVIAAIHWEALRLWRKKLSIQPRDRAISRSISWQDEQGVSHYERL
ncbi:DUF1365 domain-containing protein [Neptuniibacter halophilus]|uniref:DUF1365 domain-containing protein n=1 Tax=Neptuniibacter halophilus TaxID=651666 RepID=UPI0025738C9E|nr:DUF1365 domain-containing protein [Neptuniibacter halophilus]